jgi:hypothetical protein
MTLYLQFDLLISHKLLAKNVNCYCLLGA